MSLKSDCPHLCIGYLDPFGVGLAVGLGTDTKAGLGVCITNIFQQDVKCLQRNTSPLTTDGTEKAMLDRIPFGGPGGIVAERNARVERVRQFGLYLMFEESRTIIVAAAGIGQDQEPTAFRIVLFPLCAPPVSNRIRGKLGGVGRSAHIHQAVIPSDVIDAVGGCDAFRILSKVVCVHLDRVCPPSAAFVLERADQLFLLGVDADHGIARFQECFLPLLNVVELPVAVWVRGTGEAFTVRLQRKPFFLRSSRTVVWLTVCPLACKASCSSRRVWRTHLSSEQGSPAMSFWISCCRSSSRDGSVCVNGLRPAPARRMRCRGHDFKSSASSLRAFVKVSLSMREISESREMPPRPTCKDRSARTQRLWSSSSRSNTTRKDRIHCSSCSQGVVFSPIGKTRICSHFRSMPIMSAWPALKVELFPNLLSYES